MVDKEVKEQKVEAATANLSSAKSGDKAAAASALAQKLASNAGPAAKKALELGRAFVRRSNDVGAAMASKALALSEKGYDRTRASVRGLISRTPILSGATDVLLVFALYSVAFQVLDVVVRGGSARKAIVALAPLLAAAVIEGARRLRDKRQGR